MSNYEDGNSLNESVLNELKDRLLDENEMYDLSTMFKALSDPTRLNIIYTLSKTPLCVQDISEVLNMSQSSISHHLRTLRNARLVKFVKKGKMVIYSIDDDHVLTLFREGLDHVRHD